MLIDFKDFIKHDKLGMPECFEQIGNIAYFSESLVTHVDDGQGGTRRIEGTDPFWKIKRIAKVGSEFLTTYASQKHDKKWSDRATLFPAIPFTPQLSTDFDGVNDYINYGDINNYDIAAAFSIALWVKPNNLASTRIIFSKAGVAPNINGYMLRQEATSGNIYMQMRSGTNRNHTFDKSIIAGVWQLLVLTYAGGSNINGAHAYVNASKSSSPPSGTLSGTMLENQDYLLGQRTSALFYSGKMFQHTVWDKELTQQEVDELYNTGTPIDPLTHTAKNNLVIYNPLGDGDVFNIVSDLKNSNDGTMTNMTADDFNEDSP